MKKYDIVFIGHVTIDEIVAEEGSARGLPGGAPLFGAFAAAVSKKKIAVITRVAVDDGYILEPLKTASVDVYRQPTQETTHMRVVHPTANVDERINVSDQKCRFLCDRRNATHRAMPYSPWSPY